MQQWKNLSPVLRMTIWYLIIICALSLIFSTIVFQMASTEMRSSIYPANELHQLFIESDEVRQARYHLYETGIQRLLSNLIIFNIGVISIGGAVSYILAKRTLNPIEIALDNQTRFSSDVAHELRTPLTVMKSELEVELRNKKPKLKDMITLLKSNLEEVNRLEKMTERLLLLASRSEMIEKTIFSSSELINDVIEGLKFNAEAKNISLLNKAKKVEVDADKISLNSALTALVDNAIKYSPENTNIIISSKKRPGYSVIYVKDQGIGIKKDEQNRIFNRFYRVDKSRTKLNVEGSGLGLSIAQKIIKQHGGHIEVNSRHGKGSTFSIILPNAK